MAPNPIRTVGDRKQLFIDDLLIESRSNVALTMNPPRKTGERCIVPEHPWEELSVGSHNTILEEEGTFRMWYTVRSSKGGTRAGIQDNLAYAISQDGIHWEKPRLGLVDFRGSKENNLLLNEFAGTVFIDPRRAGGTRWKLAGWWNAVWDSGGAGVWIFESSDGLRWRPFRDRPLITKSPSTHHFDTQNQVFWDARIRKYVAYVRLNIPPRLRKVGRSEAAELDRWSEPEIVFGCDDRDPVESDHYTPCVHPYPFADDVYLMFPSAYFHLPGKRNDGPLDIQLATSRDGIHWQRLDRRPYVRLGVEGAFDAGSSYMSIGMVRRGSELWMYYTGYPVTHGYDIKTVRGLGVISRLVQRLDGFVSADAAYGGGELTTIPVLFRGARLEINVDTGALGSLRVELLDPEHHPLPGFTSEDCYPIIGNSVARRVAWKGGHDVGALAGRPIRLRFRMRATKLYAFQFVS